MRLIGMLDSPYVRRVAIALQLLGVRFHHEPLSVFRTYEQFAAINPVVKAPTLVCDDGTVLMDSTLILDYAEAFANPGRSLVPWSLPERQHDLRVIGLALAACEKAVQLVYERELRPAERRHAPWVERVTGQLHAAFRELERACRERAPQPTSEGLTHGGVIAAVAWDFTQRMVPGVVAASDRPALAAFSEQVERLPAFVAAPFGSEVCRAALR